ncbi:DUF4214 domain-containing protein [Methylobacterium durans]|uniref:DUF4214 domain-containing protein n=1 Tax=Methylobacterium durans TaxID=2202825 RepID=UPI002B003AA4|nr:DUF4214 domain-containing protein [Methylobacterium durans]MEA1834642.1 DUF4214 domain-containing protein [Methylobacterium durans]
MSLQEDTRWIESRTYVDITALYYQAGFDRPPEEGGLDFWVDQQQAGLGPIALADAIVNSAEFVAVHAGQTRAEIINTFYQNVLGRTADTDGLKFWTDSDLTLAQVLDSIARSNESLVKNAAALHGFEDAVVSGTLVVGADDLSDYKPAPLEVIREVPGPTQYDEVVKEVPVEVIKEVPVTVYVPTEPDHVVTHRYGTLDVTSTKGYQGAEVNFGAGNFATDWAITKDATSGTELGLKVHYRTGDTVVGTLQDDGSVHFEADAGSQIGGAHNAQGNAANRSAISVDFSVNAGVNTVSEGGKAFTIAVDNQYGQHFDFDLQHLSAGRDIWVNRATGVAVLGDDDGLIPHLSQNSFNFGFAGFGGHADNKAGTINITLSETNADHSVVYASQHIQIDVVDPAIVALNHDLLL